MVTRDKLNEARFFYDLMKDAKVGDDLRYLFSAFLSSWRSVTWVMQKEYRGQFKERFNSWYEGQLASLSSLPYAKELLELRTVVQHEGDLYPQLIIENVDTASGHIIRIHYDASRGHIVSCEWNLQPTGPGRPRRSLTESEIANGHLEATQEDVMGASKDLAEYMNRIKASDLHFQDVHFVLNAQGVTLSSAKMREVIELHLAALSTMVIELEATFGDLRPVLPW